MADVLIELAIRGIVWVGGKVVGLFGGMESPADHVAHGGRRAAARQDTAAGGGASSSPAARWLFVCGLVAAYYFFTHPRVARRVLTWPYRRARRRGAFAMIGEVLCGGALALLCTAPFGIHQVKQGSVGVYWFAGALQSRTTEPGYHYRVPWVTRHASIPINIRTDEVRDVPCGTKGGILLHFGKIEVVFRLDRAHVVGTVRNYTARYEVPMIHDQIHHHINEYCSHKELKQIYIDEFDQIDENLAGALRDSVKPWAPGIRFLSVRVTKPDIPAAIRRLYMDLGSVATKLKVLDQKAKTVAKLEHGKLARATQEAEKQRAISVIDAEKRVKQQEARVQIEAIDDEMRVERARGHADSRLYAAAREAESNARRLTPNFLDLQRATLGLKNTKYYYGDSVPEYIVSDPDDPITQLLVTSEGRSSGWDGVD